MIRSIIFAIFFLISILQPVMAMNLTNESYKYTVHGEIPNVETSFEEEHYLGTEITPKWNTFQANYIHQYSLEVGLSDSGTEIRKPSIYNAVERANKFIKKSLKRGVMEKKQAVEIMAHILDCANVICMENDTKEFESAARQAKTGEEVIGLFNRVELVII